MRKFEPEKGSYQHNARRFQFFRHGRTRSCLDEESHESSLVMTARAWTSSAGCNGRPLPPRTQRRRRWRCAPARLSHGHHLWTDHDVFSAWSSDKEKAPKTKRKKRTRERGRGSVSSYAAASLWAGGGRDFQRRCSVQMELCYRCGLPFRAVKYYWNFFKMVLWDNNDY